MKKLLLAAALSALFTTSALAQSAEASGAGTSSGVEEPVWILSVFGISGLIGTPAAITTLPSGAHLDACKTAGSNFRTKFGARISELTATCTNLETGEVVVVRH